MRPKLYLLIEGRLDSKFFSHALYHFLSSKFRRVSYYTYSKQPKRDTEGFIKTGLSSGRVIFVHDFDNAPCYTQLKANLPTEWASLREGDILIVRKEIESWLLAGITNKLASKLGITANTLITDNIGKEDLAHYRPSDMLMTEFEDLLVRHFDIDNAKNRNQSFKYFIERFI
jgi:hypothetical protein